MTPRPGCALISIRRIGEETPEFEEHVLLGSMPANDRGPSDHEISSKIRNTLHRPFEFAPLAEGGGFRITTATSIGEVRFGASANLAGMSQALAKIGLALQGPDAEVLEPAPGYAAIDVALLDGEIYFSERVAVQGTGSQGGLSVSAADVSTAMGATLSHAPFEVAADGHGYTVTTATRIGRVRFGNNAVSGAGAGMALSRLAAAMRA